MSTSENSRNIRVPTFSSLQFKSSVHDSFSIYCPSKKSEEEKKWYEILIHTLKEEYFLRFLHA